MKFYPFQPGESSFAGDWVKDYLRSENWEMVLINQMNQLRRDAERQAARPGGDQRGRQRPVIDLSKRTRGSTANIVDLARFTELITRHHTMHITRENDVITIKREDEADLICGVGISTVESFSSNYGSELCGWEGQQLLFRIILPEGIDILHRLTLSPDAQFINMTTRVSDKGSLPFTLIEVYERFENPDDDFDCTQTLSRGRVCKRATTEP